MGREAPHPGRSRPRARPVARALTLVVLLLGAGGLAPGLAVEHVALTGQARAASPAELLRTRPLVPADRGLFSNGVYRDAPAMRAAAGHPPDEAGVTRLLESYLRVEFPGSPASRDAAMAVFNDATARRKVPSPSLRAGLAALKGTVAEAAIDWLLYARLPNGREAVSAVWFADGSLLSDSRLNAQSFIQRETGQIDVRVNHRHRSESPFLFARVLAHEVLHQDLNVNKYEETAALSLDILVYVQQLARHPELARTGTRLSRLLNSAALARLNSGRGTQLGMYSTRGGAAVLPGSSAFRERSWFAFVSRYELPKDAHLSGSRSTPGNSLLGAYLRALSTGSGTRCSAGAFSRELLDCIDGIGRGRLTPRELAAAAAALRLRPAER